MPSGVIKHKALIFGGIGLLLAAIGVIASLVLMNLPQDVRQKAATETGTAQIKISPATATIQPGQSTTATVSFNTAGQVIQGIAVELNYAYSGTVPPMVASEIVVDPTMSSSGFACDTKTITDTVSPVKIEVGCTITNGFSSETFRDLFRFKLTAGADGSDNPIPVTFNTTNTIIAKGLDDIAAIPTGNLTVTLPPPAVSKQMDIAYSAKCNPSKLEVVATLTNGDGSPVTGTNVRFNFDNQNLEKVTDADGDAFVVFTYSSAGSYVLTINADGFTEQRNTVQISACAAATPTPTPTPTPAIDGTISCNGSCLIDSDCISSLFCYSGQCRSASCQSDTTCQCLGSDVGSTTTELPTTGSLDRTIVLLLIGGLLTVGGLQVLLGRGSHTETEWTEGDSNP